MKSSIDGRALDGVPSIRVHNGTDYMGSWRFIRWTEVFILQVCYSLPTPYDADAIMSKAFRFNCLGEIERFLTFVSPWSQYPFMRMCVICPQATSDPSTCSWGSSALTKVLSCRPRYRANATTGAGQFRSDMVAGVSVELLFQGATRACSSLR